MRYLSELWPAIGEVHAQTSMAVSHEWELPYGERAVVDAIVRYVQPRVSFEFGTFSGSTTTLIAEAAPHDAVVHTIDVPDDQVDDGYRRLGVTSEMIGSRLDDAQSSHDKIEFHRQLIEEFDFAALRGAATFVFVDASHDYESVRYDSTQALEMLGVDGVIVWDDYQTWHSGVTIALDELSISVDLAHVATTRLVVHGRGRFAFAGADTRTDDR
jgi:hypothetical protein